MLVERDELTEHARREGRREDRGRRPVARERSGRHEGSGRTLGLDLFGGLAESERLGLREEVREEQSVHVAAIVLERVGRVDERDEVGRDQAGALVDQLVERVLAVRPRLAPEHLAGVGRDGCAIPAHGLAVGLHRQLLQVRREAVQLLRVGEHRVRLRVEEVRVPDVEQAHQDRHVGRERRGAHVLVDVVEAAEQFMEDVGAERDRQRQSDRRVDGVAPADPVPEPERVRGIDAELRDLVERGRDRDEVVRDGVGPR